MPSWFGAVFWLGGIAFAVAFVTYGVVLGIRGMPGASGKAAVGALSAA
jgi:hypothetical protein